MGASAELEPDAVFVDPAALQLGLLVAFSNRIGGVSKGPFESLNLAVAVGDEPAAVRINRGRVSEAAGFRVENLVLARQAHGCRIQQVGSGLEPPCLPVDGFVTSEPGVLGLLTADCAAVILAGADSLALIHAGWRGLAAGIIDRCAEKLGSVRQAWIGPSIRECCYEVGREVEAMISAQGLPARRGRLDIPAVAEEALRRAGVARVIAFDACTGCDGRYFSFRREGLTGRQGAFASILPATQGSGSALTSES
jgi:YfiH family protein